MNIYGMHVKDTILTPRKNNKIIKSNNKMDCCFYPRRPQILVTKPDQHSPVVTKWWEVEYLKVQHDFNQLAAVGRGQATPLVQDCLQLRTRQFIKVQLHKPIPEGSGKHLGSVQRTTR